VFAKQLTNYLSSLRAETLGKSATGFMKFLVLLSKVTYSSLFRNLESRSPNWVAITTRDVNINNVNSTFNTEVGNLVVQ
jgi:hypothetical protein